LPQGNRGDDEVAKAVETIKGGDPYIAFTIFEELIDVIARQTVRLRKAIYPSLVYM
jgi:hypothetical protein